MNMWHHLQLFSRPGKSVPLPSYVLLAVASPAWTRCMLMERGVASRVMGHCIEALVAKDLVAGVKLSTTSTDPNVRVHDDKLAWLSAIVGIESNDMKPCLECPGAVELTIMFSLVFGDVGPLDVNALPSDVHNAVQKTLVILSRTTALQMHQPDPQLNTAFERIIVSGFRDLIQMCNPVASELTATARRSCLWLCLKSLWYCVNAYHQPGASKPLPSYFPTICSKDFIDFIEAQQDPVSRVVGRCFGALVVIKLVADARYRVSSASEYQVFQLNDDEEDCLTAVLDINIEDRIYMGHKLLDREHRVLDRGHQISDRGHQALRQGVQQPGVVEICNVVLLVLQELNLPAADKIVVPPYVLDVIPQTFSIISRAFPAELNTELGLDWVNTQANITPDGQCGFILSIPSPRSDDALEIAPSNIGELYRKHSIECLKNLWCHLRAYHQPGNSQTLPSYVLITFAGPRWTQRISKTRDVAIGVMGRCLEALVIRELVAGVKPSTNPNVQSTYELERLSAILRTDINGVKNCIGCPGIFELVAMVQIVSVGVDSLGINALPLDVRYVAKQTLASLSQAAGRQLDQPVTQLDSDENFDRVIASGLQNVYQMCLPGSSTLTAAARRSCLGICLTNLCQWYCGKMYRQLEDSELFPYDFIITLANREIQTEQGPVSHVMGRCLCALVAMKLVADVRLRADSNVQIELASLSAILGIESEDVKFCLELPGAVEITSMVSLVLCDVFPFPSNLPSTVKDVANRVLVILSQALPVEKAGLQPMTWSQNLNEKPVVNLVSNFNDLLQMCISGNSVPTAKVHRSCLRMCLKTLWNCVKTYLPHRFSGLLMPSHLFDTCYTSEFIRHIQTEEDPASRVMGCCFFALASILWLNRHRDSHFTESKISWFTYLSTVLGTKNDDLESCLECPDTVEQACMISIVWGDIGFLDINALPQRARDIAQQTLAILSEEARLYLDQPIAQLNISDGELGRNVASGLYVFHQYISSTPWDPLTCESEMERTSTSCLRLLLDCLWYCAKAYHQLGASKPLPSYFPSTLASPEIILLIHGAQDPVSCTTGCCFGALVVMKLAADIRSRAGLDLQISNEELECLSSILGAKGPTELKRWLSQHYAVELANIFSLIFSEINSLFSDTGPSEVLDKIQQTYSILSRTLPAELSAKLTNFTTDGQCRVHFSSRQF